MATPARSTRARSRQTTPQPLPAVDVRTSHGYGSRGRAKLHNQLAGAGATLADAFATGRDGAGIAPVFEESVEDEEELHTQPPMSRQGTVVESMAHYEGSRRSERHESMPPPPPVPAAFRAATPPPPPPPAEPWTLSVLLFAVPRYLWRNIWAVLLGAFLFGSYAVVPLPGMVSDRRDEFFRGLKIAAGVPGYDLPPAHLERLWMFVRSSAFHAEELQRMAPIDDPLLQRMVNVRLRGLIDDLDANQTALGDRVSAIEEFLPLRTVVDVIEGNMVITDDFWNALSRKLRGEPEFFDSFIAASEQTFMTIADASVHDYFDGALRERRILSREEMLELLNQSGKDLEKRLSSLVQAGTDDAVNAARTVAAQVAREIAENTPSDLRNQLAVLAKSNLLANTYEALTSVNFFSPNTGALIDPHHTSPTALKPKKDTNAGWFANSLKRPTLPPAFALTKWDEMGDCWCAAKSEDMSYAQLAVMTDNPIAPRRLIVEHIPAGGTTDINKAPRDFELWAETNSVEEAKTTVQNLKNKNMHYGVNKYDKLTGPTETSVCIASGQYDIHAENWVQSVPMLADMEEFPTINATKFYFRVWSNWGSDQTCIYRVRLTGTDLTKVVPI